MLITTSAVLLVFVAVAALIAIFYFFRSLLCSDPYEDEINNLNRNIQ